VEDTDPMDGNSALCLNSLWMNSGTPMLNVCQSPSRDYFVEQSTDMKNWTVVPMSAQVNAAVANAAIANPPPSPKAYYRLVVP